MLTYSTDLHGRAGDVVAPALGFLWGTHMIRLPQCLTQPQSFRDTFFRAANWKWEHISISHNAMYREPSTSNPIEVFVNDDIVVYMKSLRRTFLSARNAYRLEKCLMRFRRYYLTDNTPNAIALNALPKIQPTEPSATAFKRQKEPEADMHVDRVTMSPFAFSVRHMGRCCLHFVVMVRL